VVGWQKLTHSENLFNIFTVKMSRQVIIEGKFDNPITQQRKMFCTTLGPNHYQIKCFQCSKRCKTVIHSTELQRHCCNKCFPGLIYQHHQKMSDTVNCYWCDESCFEQVALLKPIPLFIEKGRYFEENKHFCSYGCYGSCIGQPNK